MSKFHRARSLLYQRQSFQNILWKALDEIYKIYMLLHRSDLNISEIFESGALWWSDFLILLKFFVKFFSIFWQNFATFRHF